VHKRNAALDLGRFVAAIIVACGHFLFQDLNNLMWSTRYSWLSIFELGPNCVLFFFALSGYVLSGSFNQSIKPSIWLRSRFARLLPIYYTAWVLPLIGWIYVSHKAPFNLIGGALGALASQSLLPSHAIDGPNPPLWSLSIELYLSIIFVLVAYHKKRFIALCGSVLLVLVLSPFLGIDIAASHRLLLGLPFFLTGMILQRQSQRLIVKRPVNYCLIALGFFVIFLFPKQLIQVSGSPWGTIFNLVLVVILLLPLSQVHLVNLAARWSTALGARSFALYASHFPVILFSRHFVSDGLRDKPVLYVASIVVAVIVGTEFVFRFVETPAIKWSRSIRKAG